MALSSKQISPKMSGFIIGGSLLIIIAVISIAVGRTNFTFTPDSQPTHAQLAAQLAARQQQVQNCENTPVVQEYQRQVQEQQNLITQEALAPSLAGSLGPAISELGGTIANLATQVQKVRADCIAKYGSSQ